MTSIVERPHPTHTGADDDRDARPLQLIAPQRRLRHRISRSEHGKRREPIVHFALRLAQIRARGKPLQLSRNRDLVWHLSFEDDRHAARLAISSGIP